MDFFMVRHTPRMPRPFRMEGVTFVMTPRPDEAELEAQALLESLTQASDVRKADDPGKGTAEYYRLLSRRIRDARASEKRGALRCIAYCEQELMKPSPTDESLAGMEQDLYRRLELIDREGGALKERWQRCYADVTVRQMSSVDRHMEEEYTEEQ